MSSGPGRRLQILQDIILVAAAQVSTYYLIRYIVSRLDPDRRESDDARQKSAAVLRRLGDKGLLDSSSPRRDGSSGSSDAGDERRRSQRRRPKKEELKLNQYEQAIAMEVVAPEDIPVTFEDIGGLDDIIEELKESVIYPLTLPHLYSYSSSLLSAPSGVLLYGPPGCGKTMLAKALAHESGACFINLHISTLTEKWYGDSNKMVNAVFSLARKLQPSIVFIDEIDAVLGTRRSGEHEASGMVKAEFMTHWDGLTSSKTTGESEQIMILGATNRIQDIDEAILRRMPKKFPVFLPSASQRRRILNLILRETKLDRERFDAEAIVRATTGLSGSDIKEACREAAMVPVREFIRERRKVGQGIGSVSIDIESVRGVRTDDFFAQHNGKSLTEGAEAAEAADDVDDEVHESRDSQASRR
ncbi:MAG: hypothetical protein M1815_000116 [Lichina confinis]|nr:MAG: hypothetical protein M1815_000116 [Lichina confinis]